MRTEQFPFESESFRSNRLQPPSLASRYLKNCQPKTQTEESSPSSKPPSLKQVHNSLNKHQGCLNDVSRSQTFTATFCQSRGSMPREHSSVFGQKYVSREGEINYQSLRDTSSEMLGKRSVQFLAGLNRSSNKTQYSKIIRRKEEMLRKNAITDQAEKIEPIHRTQQFSEEKLIEKYRELILKKDNRSSPFNMVNKLYQIQLLTAKEAIIMPKDGVRALPCKLDQLNNNSNSIEFKVSKIIHKPYDIDRVKEMLSQKDLSSQPQSQKQKNIRLLQSQGAKTQSRPSESMRKQTQNRQKTEASCKISQLRVKQPLSQKIESIKYESPIKNVAKNHAYPPPPKNVSAAAYIVYEVFKDIRKFSSLKRSELQGPRRKQNCSGQIHSAFNIKTSSQIASLTKIMTCIVVIELCQRLSIDTQSERYKVGYFQSQIKGTSAEIQPGDIYTIHQLLLGLMLPSGNDASLALARWAGNVFLISDADNQKKKNQMIQHTFQTINNVPEEWGVNNKYLRCRTEKLKARRCYNRFLAEMNKKARLLGLERTTYVNSHGLSNPHNKSCCLDQAILCQYAIQNNYFCQIVSCKEYEGFIDKEIIISSVKGKRISLKVKRNIDREDPEQMNLDQDAEGDEMQNRSSSESEDDEDNEEENDTQIESSPSIRESKDNSQVKQKEKKTVFIKKAVKWTNTHKLLQKKKEYFGIKTGVTVTAGACLASYLAIAERNFVIVVFNCKKMSMRFTDTQILRHWVSKKENIGKSESVLTKYEEH